MEKLYGFKNKRRIYKVLFYYSLYHLHFSNFEYQGLWSLSNLRNCCLKAVDGIPASYTLKIAKTRESLIHTGEISLPNDPSRGDSD